MNPTVTVETGTVTQHIVINKSIRLSVSEAHTLVNNLNDAIRLEYYEHAKRARAFYHGSDCTN